ncbi:MAG: T9SS type A sorting domain-containing protein [Bacteroidales bacterium]|nr:T9SS type A sorting domain-containing protein [Bacteroidales bacterium]
MKYGYAPFGEFTVKDGPVYISPMGPIIVINNKLYSVNGKMVLDTVSFQANEEIIVGTLLKVSNLGSDISQNTLITIYPGPFYKVITDSLPANCTRQGDNIIVSLGNLIPGESKEQLLYYKVTDTDQSDDLIRVIRMSDVEYKGTALAGTFKYTDPKEVKLFVYEFRSKKLSFEASNTNEVTVTAEAKNLGIPAANVWFRIYPVIDGGIREFPLAEMKLDSFKTGATITLTGNFTIIPGHKTEFVAVIDDGEKVYEILENNNIKTVLFSGATGFENISETTQNMIYPNPVWGEITFKYNLPNKMDKVSISITGTKGNDVWTRNDCPSEKGTNIFEENISELPAGTYYYSIKANGKNNKTLNYTGKIVKK